MICVLSAINQDEDEGEGEDDEEELLIEHVTGCSGRIDC